MAGLTLSRGELLVLLEALQFRTIVGFEPTDLVPADETAHTALVEQGLASLQERKLVEVRGDGLAIDEVTQQVITVMADPEMALLVMFRSGDELQQAWFYQRGELCFEHVMPDAETHHIVGHPTLEQLIVRIVQIMPIQTTMKGARGILPQTVFAQAKELAESRQVDQAVAVLKGPFEPEAAKAIVDAMYAPTYSGSIAILRCANDEIIDARSFAILQGETTAWLFRQPVESPETFDIISADYNMLAEQVLGWFIQLSQVTA